VNLMKRSARAAVAQQTVEIVKQGRYDLADGRTVDLAPLVDSCLSATRLYLPEELEQTRQSVLAAMPDGAEAIIEVCNESTLSGIFRLLTETGGPVAALNFASAKNPGGGFLNGSQAQEESLARSSALYASLLRAPEYYERHRASKSCLYSDAMIVSPDCPIFRGDDGNLLEKPVVVTFITSAAPNAGAIAANMPEELPLIQRNLRRRSEYVLALAAAHGCRVLILGAWGCGVFRNDPAIVADAFAGHIGKGAPWSRRFGRIVFSVLDASPARETLGTFVRVVDRLQQEGK
jgi:uncharacterized protein (TIGR02452 family)